MSANGELNRWMRNTILTSGVALLTYFASGAVSENNKKLDRAHELAVRAISRSSDQSTEIAVIKSQQDDLRGSQTEIKRDLKQMSDKVDRLIELQWQTLSAAKRIENR